MISFCNHCAIFFSNQHIQSSIANLQMEIVEQKLLPYQLSESNGKHIASIENDYSDINYFIVKFDSAIMSSK